MKSKVFVRSGMEDLKGDRKRASKEDARGERERYAGPVDNQLGEYFKGLTREREALDSKEFPNITRLIQQELSTLVKRPGDLQNHIHQNVDLYQDTPITLTVKCFPPSKDFPKFNYAGRILGPRGAYLKSIMRETMTKMVLLGKGVMKDKEKEQELRESGDPKYFHLNEEMHVTISVSAPAAEAYHKASYAISCLKRQVVSDNKDLLSLPWIVRVIENGEGPPQAYIQHEQDPHPSGHGIREHVPVPRRNASPPPPTRRLRPPASAGYALLPPPQQDGYMDAPSHYYDYPPQTEIYRRYSPEPSPRAPPPRESFYDDPAYSRRSGRSPRGEFVEKPRSMLRSSRPERGSRGSPPPSSHLEYPAEPISYYPIADDGRGGSWTSASYPLPQKAVKPYGSSTRYAPYK